ncbi:hypothetical protein [uncultured Desulfovibrio sp.]|uniref:hypothetical protein n=1 Tax=uncultured Desulfovibrio sp. TaxID=167968 RepID=UPI00272C7CA5|nr:hypothetical protein [uncultured Desulfovibrio sp.]
MRNSVLDEIEDKDVQRYRCEILDTLKKLEHAQPRAGLPSSGGNFSCRIKAFEICVLAMSDFLSDDHFTVTVQLHDKVEITGKTWIEA